MPNSRVPPFALLALLLPLLLAVGGCDNTIDPYGEKGTYGVHGYMNVAGGDQFIRVKSLPVPLGKVDSNSVDADVTVENLESGTTTRLQDSVFAFEDANTRVLAHNFWTDKKFEPKTKYRLTVDGSEGTVHATAVTPVDTRPLVDPRKGGCGENVKVVFRDMTSQERLRVRLQIMLEEAPGPLWVTFPQENFGRTEEGWLTTSFRTSSLISASGARYLDLPSLPRNKDPACWRVSRCAALESNRVRIRFLYLGPEWFGDVPEDSVLYDPLQSRGVTNGLGFFGAAFQDIEIFQVEPNRFIYTGGEDCNQDPPGT